MSMELPTIDAKCKDQKEIRHFCWEKSLCNKHFWLTAVTPIFWQLPGEMLSFNYPPILP